MTEQIDRAFSSPRPYIYIFLVIASLWLLFRLFYTRELPKLFRIGG